jgi:two-component sensor histidine kinase
MASTVPTDHSVKAESAHCSVDREEPSQVGPSQVGPGVILVPVACVVVATIVRHALQPLVGQQFPYFSYYIAVVVSAWYGGWLSGALAFIFGYLTASYLFVSPPGSMIPSGTGAWMSSLFVTITSTITIVLFEQHRRLHDELLRRTVRTQEALQAEQAAHEAHRLHAAEIEQLNNKLQLAMRETHHRVKNNLQIIAAMVDLRVMEDEETIPTVELERLNRHIRALAIVHDILTHEAKLDSGSESMPANEGVTRVLAMLETMFPRLTIVCRLDDIRVPQRYGSSLAIVVNELVSNAAKHGARSVMVTMAASGSQARLDVSDDGPGFPPEFDASKNANTGLELVENVARWDMAAVTHYRNGPDGGATVALRFPLVYPVPAPVIAAEPMGATTPSPDMTR